MEREEVERQIGRRVLEILELAASLSKPEPATSLTDLRKSFGLSMTDLAERVGCSASYISMLESGKVDNPSVRDREVLKRLASQLSTFVVISSEVPHGHPQIHRGTPVCNRSDSRIVLAVFYGLILGLVLVRTLGRHTGRDRRRLDLARGAGVRGLVSGDALAGWRGTMTREERCTYFASRQWFLLRERVRERCSDTCEHCGASKMAQVHHKTYERMGNELLEDLLGVCEPCHLWLSGKTDVNPARKSPDYELDPVRFPTEEWLHDCDVLCPECGFNYCHPVSVSCNPAGESDSGVVVDRKGVRYTEKSIVGRGVEIVIGFQCESAHAFDVVYHFHKGVTHRYFRNIKDIKNDAFHSVIWRD
jgi:DNA-binding transcriptional regulator YiaG